MTKSKQGGGTTRTIRDRATGAVLGYQALMPRGMSKAPPGCKNPKTYQQKVGPRCATRAAALLILAEAITARKEVATLSHGLTFSHYLRQEMKVRHLKAKTDFKLSMADDPHAAADAHLAAWRSADRIHFSNASFYEYPPNAIEIETLQAWIDSLQTDYESKRTGEPLSPGSAANIGEMLRAVFDRAKVKPNPMSSVELPSKGDPRFVHLDGSEQFCFFGSDEIPLRDRVMAGCMMAMAGRIGELISLEPKDLHIGPDAVHGPHVVARFGGRKHRPTKGRAPGRVELFEPGLGFFRLWMRDYYRGGARVFEGPSGGVLSNWALNFSRAPEEGKRSWSEIVGKKITSHVMRHTHAVAMLSGTWGYDPQSLDFVQGQLRHSSRAVTEKYYAAYEDGSRARQVRHMTGNEIRLRGHEVTALALLGLADASFDASGPKNLAKIAVRSVDGRPENGAQTNWKTGSSDASTHQTLVTLSREVLRAVQAGEPLPYIATLAAELARLAGSSVTQTEAGAE